VTNAHINIALYQEALTKNQFIITANSRLANHILRAHLSYKQEISETQELIVDYRPPVYSLHDWITQLWQQLQFNNYQPAAENIIQPHLRLALWEDIINHSDLAANLMITDSLASNADAALRNLELWKLNEENVKKYEYITTNSEIWLSWFSEFKIHLKQKKLITQENAIELLIDAFKTGVLSKKPIIHLAGFDDIPPLHQELLSAATTQLNTLHKTKKNSLLQRTQTNTTEEEITAAALWSKQQLEKNPSAVIGIVVPNLGQCRAQVERVFTEVFEPLAAFAEQPSYTLPFNFSAGIPLSQTPIIATGLDLLRLQKNEWELDAICHLLMSPFFGKWDREWIIRSQLTNKLRKLGKFTITRSDLIYHCQKIESTLSESSLLTSYFTQLETHHRTSLSKHTANDWIIYFQQLLTTFSWPGNRKLNSQEHQQVKLWYQVLELFLQWDSISKPLSYTQALQQLRKLANQTPFQAQTPYSPIQILGALEASGLEFSHCWVMGLDDRQWPQQAAPNPFLPLSLQRTYKMPHASAERELVFAQTLTAHYHDCAKYVILSSAKMHEDTPVNPSRLIQSIEEKPLQDIIKNQLSVWEKNRQTLANQSSLEVIDIATAPSVNLQKEFVGGGSTLFKEQAMCPFNAFAKLRLGAERIDPPYLGFSAIDRGNLLHFSLAYFWRKINSQANLMLLNPVELDEHIAEAVTQSLHQLSYKFSRGLSSYYLDLENIRLKQLLQKWMLEEKKRPAFTVIAIEEEIETEYADLPLKLRIDRIDQLDNGDLVLIDYKTGNPKDKDWYDERMDEPQLPLYCATSKRPIHAIAFAQINATATQFIGIGDLTTAHPGIKQSPLNWAEQMAEWNVTLTQLAHEFIHGVTPLRFKHQHQMDYAKELAPFNRFLEKENIINFILQSEKRKKEIKNV
jgi:ATP-dependent helicase/nuclease subunit B